MAKQSKKIDLGPPPWPFSSWETIDDPLEKFVGNVQHLGWENIVDPLERLDTLTSYLWNVMDYIRETTSEYKGDIDLTAPLVDLWRDLLILKIADEVPPLLKRPSHRPVDVPAIGVRVRAVAAAEALKKEEPLTLREAQQRVARWLNKRGYEKAKYAKRKDDNRENRQITADTLKQWKKECNEGGFMQKRYKALTKPPYGSTPSAGLILSVLFRPGASIDHDYSKEWKELHLALKKGL